MKHLPKQARALLSKVENNLRIPIFPRDRILSASSEDGLTWTRDSGVALDIGGSHGCEMVYWPHVVHLAGFQRMYFVGSGAPDNDGFQSRILSAVSFDGSRWEPEAGERLVPDTLNGEKSIFAPCVVPFSGGMRMYYSSKSYYGTTRIVSAVSIDGLQWEKEKGVRVAPAADTRDNLGAASVVKNDSGWLMACGIQREACSSLALLHSSDGINWPPLSAGDTKILAPGPSKCVDSPSVVLLDGSIRLYYAAHYGTVYKAKIFCTELEDDSRCSDPVECLDYSGKFEGFEVEYCNVVKTGTGSWKMYYTGFPGKHLLYPYTKLVYLINSLAARRKNEMQGRAGGQDE